MAVSATLTNVFSVTETATDPLVAATDNTVTFSGLNMGPTTLDAGSTPPVTKQASFELAMVDGAATIDLTALPGAFGSVVNGTGLKLVAILVVSKAGNANAIGVAEGASNGYPLGSEFDLPVAGAREFKYFGAGGGTIGSSDRILDVTGVGTQVLQVQILMG